MQGILVRQVVLRPGLQPIEAIQLTDGSKGASVRSICMLLDLSRQGQVQRIKRTPELAPALTLVNLATPKGLRVFDVLPSRTIPPWLLGIDTGRLAPHKQELVTFLKESIVAAIERAFSSQGTSAVMEEFPPTAADWQPPQEGRAAIEESASQLKGVLITFDQRLLSLEHAPHSGETLGMLPERIANLHLLAWYRRAVTSIPVADTLAALAEQFGVTEIVDIPAARWPDVLAALEEYMRQDMQLAQASQRAAPAITPERLAALRAMPYEEYLQTPEWRACRQGALRRALYRCQLCNSPEPPLIAHHRTYERLGAEWPEDLIVLCDRCHLRYHRLSNAPTDRR